MNLKLEEKLFYDKLKFISSIRSKTQYDSRKLTDSDLYQICQYTEPHMIANDRHKLLKRLIEYKDPESGDSCLHIAAKSSNKKLVQYFVENKIIDANRLNNYKQNALISLLRNSDDKKSEQIAFILARYTDLNARNQDGDTAFGVRQAKMDPVRARLLQYLREQAAGK